MKTMDDAELPYLDGVEVLVVNALRWEKPPTVTSWWTTQWPLPAASGYDRLTSSTRP
jgi:hypothetical protein